MKITMLFSILLVSMGVCAQNNIHYNFMVNTTFTANENFGNYDEYEDERDWDVIVPRALLFRNGFEVTLNHFVSVGINLGLDWHQDLDVLAIPYFIDSKFTIIKENENRFFIGGGIGKLLKVGDSFERGKYYKVGVGYQIAVDKTHSFIFNMDFHQKKIEDFENGRLNSLSFGMGMSFL